MARHVTVLMGILAALACCNAAAIHKPLSKRPLRLVQNEEMRFTYTAPDTTLAMPGQTDLFIASTCNHFMGQEAEVTLVLLNNPAWNVQDGVVYFYVTDNPQKGLNDSNEVLCTNNVEGEVVTARCIVTDVSCSELYIYTRAGDVFGIAYSVTVEFRQPNDTRKVVKEKPKVSTKHFPIYVKDECVHHLIQSVSLRAPLELVSLTTAQMTIPFCPNAEQENLLSVETSVLSVSGLSAYTQYACLKTPCEVDSPNVIASSPEQRPLNSLRLESMCDKHTSLTVLVHCWGGEQEEAGVGDYVGKFNFAAGVNLKSPTSGVAKKPMY
ncbi:uncharacterized protein LOC118406906 [Branchiostoma floridae]|uniref:Uncharacterized protein LOC118406906 n=1 Tax=Branchiostoma floridae TaxID=7739 RepID=A0A9J7KKC6_BRAFL|nr:uncharacterized protein LOC118406906 [Branchiostoma floridae]